MPGKKHLLWEWSSTKELVELCPCKHPTVSKPRSRSVTIIRLGHSAGTGPQRWAVPRSEQDIDQKVRVQTGRTHGRAGQGRGWAADQCSQPAGEEGLRVLGWAGMELLGRRASKAVAPTSIVTVLPRISWWSNAWISYGNNRQRKKLNREWEKSSFGLIKISCLTEISAPVALQIIHINAFCSCITTGSPLLPQSCSL